MNFVRLGKRFLNLDQISEVEETPDGCWVFFNNVRDTDDNILLRGNEAKALIAYLELDAYDALERFYDTQEQTR